MAPQGASACYWHNGRPTYSPGRKNGLKSNFMLAHAPRIRQEFRSKNPLFVMIFTPTSPEKTALRLEMKARRAAINEAQRQLASRQMCERIFSFLSARSERSIGVYLARPPEISLDILIGELLREGIEIAAPRVDLAREEMSFWRLESLEETEIGPWNVRQPPALQKMKEVPLVIVPGLAFDRFGARLGSGGGWYDRTLTASQIVIGAAFDCQIVPRVPTESHDRRVDFVASENCWIEIGNSIGS